MKLASGEESALEAQSRGGRRPAETTGREKYFFSRVVLKKLGLERAERRPARRGRGENYLILWGQGAGN